ncbi:uncharacterized protein LOC141938710 [Strix uralensis]|uniref:uncharacterized protein LOC141938710 n=1 Tax=Strix uralensis TaxID=36305 RepID=UPI003DA4A072
MGPRARTGGPGAAPEGLSVSHPACVPPIPVGALSHPHGEAPPFSRPPGQRPPAPRAPHRLFRALRGAARLGSAPRVPVTPRRARPIAARRPALTPPPRSLLSGGSSPAGPAQPARPWPPAAIGARREAKAVLNGCGNRPGRAEPARLWGAPRGSPRSCPDVEAAAPPTHCHGDVRRTSGSGHAQVLPRPSLLQRGGTDPAAQPPPQLLQVPAARRAAVAPVAGTDAPGELAAHPPPAPLQRPLRALLLPAPLGRALPAARRRPHHLPLQPHGAPPTSHHAGAAVFRSRGHAGNVSTVPIVSRAALTPLLPPDKLSTEELVAVAVVLQRKVKVLQQRRRRHRARLAAVEGLVEQLRRDSLVSEERLKLACLQPVTPDPAGAVTIICQEEEEAALVYGGTSCGLGLAGPL